MSYITDITHYLDEDGYPVSSGPAGRIGEFFGRIVAAASLHARGDVVPSALRCRRCPGRKLCPGNLLIAHRDDGVLSGIHFIDKSMRSKNGISEKNRVIALTKKEKKKFSEEAISRAYGELVRVGLICD